MLLIAVLWLVCGAAAAARYSWECAAPGLPTVAVTLQDKPPGRVRMRYCTEADELVTRWDLVLDVLQDVPPAACSYERLGERRRGARHSSSEEHLRLQQINCTHVCFSRTLDLVYRGCYRLQNKLVRGRISSEPYNSYYYSQSRVTSPDYYANVTQLYKDFDNDLELVVRWYQGPIPIEEFTVDLQRTDSAIEEEFIDVTSNCTLLSDSTSVRCVWSVPPGCYRAILTHRAPWASSALLTHLAYVHATFCHDSSGPAPIATSPPVGAATWALVGVLVVGAAAVGGAALYRLRARRWGKGLKPLPIPLAGVPVSSELPAMRVSAAGNKTGRVLLLYARECAAGERLATKLTKLLHNVADEVLDLYSPETVAMSAPAPAEWLRHVMTSSQLILLQTPALACLYTSHHSHLSSPLLGVGAVYAAPMFGDSLLALALRLLVEGPPTPMPYRAYYLATLERLNTEALPHVVPYRRYELPGATCRLLADLSPASQPIPPHDPQVLELSEAADELVEYVTNNENYLADQLMFL